jgi:type IV pilus assembly protein PilE
MNHRISSRAQGSRVRRTKGFTLIELIVVMVIASILAAIAIPSYSNYVRKSRRTDAKTALLNLASLEERYFSTANVYSATATDVGYAAWPATVGNNDYTIAAPVIGLPIAPTTAAPGGTPATYTFTATPIGDQAKDVLCASFTISSTGQQTATGTDPNPSVDCWK